MCDTFVALPKHTASGSVIFAKNSDREPNEAQVVVRIPAQEQAQNTVACTHISIPQVTHTNEVILCRPFQMWGAEMGVNEHGVAIGNEAVFTKIPITRNNKSLTGMDLLRLALERSNTACHALNCITNLLQQYGQNACGGYQNKRFFYHNSFLIADAREAWVLETAGKHWAAQRVTQSFRSISNGLTLEEDFDLHSRGLMDFALQQKLIKPYSTFNFRQAFSDTFYTYMSSCKIRQTQSSIVGNENEGHFLPAHAMQILASHYPPDNADFLPQKASTKCICMHATGITNPSQTVGSMVAELRPNKAHTVWVTGTSMPCLSVFKPLFFTGNALPGKWAILPDTHADNSLWWQAETLHRRAILQYPSFTSAFTPPKMRLQNTLIGNELRHIGNAASHNTLEYLSEQAIDLHLQLIEEGIGISKKRGNNHLLGQLRHYLYWKKQNRAANIS